MATTLFLSTSFFLSCFFFNDTATTEIYTLSLHDALPICAASRRGGGEARGGDRTGTPQRRAVDRCAGRGTSAVGGPRSEEHTSELQSRQYLVCRLLLEKKKRRALNSTTVQTISPIPVIAT